MKDYHSNLRENSGTLRSPDITNSWCQQEENNWKYANFFNVAGDIFSIIPYEVGVESSFSLGQDIISWRQSKTASATLQEKYLVRQFARANNGILAGDNTSSDTTDTENDVELKNEVDERNLHTLAKVHNFLEMWQGSQNLGATQKQSRTHNKQMTAVGYISDTKEIIKASWSNFQHDGTAAFKLSERSLLPPALSAKDLPWGWTKVLNARQVKRIDHHPSENHEDSAPESISDTYNCFEWNGYLDNPKASNDNWEGDNESDMELENGIDSAESREHQDVSTALNVSRKIRPTQMSMKLGELGLMTDTAMETRSKKGNKK